MSDAKFSIANQVKAFFANAKGDLYKILGAMFIVVFDVLILTCPFLIISGHPLVNAVAVYAYYFLILGVIFQALSYIKYKKYRSGVFEEKS